MATMRNPSCTPRLRHDGEPGGAGRSPTGSLATRARHARSAAA
jgi:hypothetical protein